MRIFEREFVKAVKLEINKEKLEKFDEVIENIMKILKEVS